MNAPHTRHNDPEPQEKRAVYVSNVRRFMAELATPQERLLFLHELAVAAERDANCSCGEAKDNFSASLWLIRQAEGSLEKALNVKWPGQGG